jgi:hypothetical protein
MINNLISMKRLSASFALLVLFAFSIFAQSYLSPYPGYEARDIFKTYNNFQAIDIYDTLLYGSDGDTIHCLDLGTGKPLAKYGKPADYTSFPSFLAVSPDGEEIWAGFTVIGNTDDRIYRIDVESGEWHLEALLSGNIDLVWWNDSILVSGLNSASWDAPGSIFVLDTSGQDKHRKIIQTGGFAAGLAVDTLGSLYYGTSYSMDPNVLLKWDSTTIAGIMADIGSDTLRPGDADKLSDLTAGPYDAHIDAGGNLLFNMNLIGGDKVIARWNGTEGDGLNYDIMAIATGQYDWLGYIKSEGNIDSLPGLEGAIGLDGEGFVTGSGTRNRLVVTGAGRLLAEIYRDNPAMEHPYIDKVWEYKPAPGQFINAAPLGLPYSAESIVGGINGALSLGAFGGYVVYSFEEAVENNPDNPFGVDFTIFGNPSMQWSEPGVVSVMVDENKNGRPDDTWYELAGSDYHFSSTIQDYSVEYENPGDTADVPWTDNQDGSGFVLMNDLHKQSYYPEADLFPGVDPVSYSLAGTRIQDAVDDSNPWMISHRRDFGYVDNQVRGALKSLEPFKSLEPLKGSKLAYAASAQALPDNPYTREVENIGGDAFDIGWAVDSSGDYVDLDRIHFVKVHTGVMAHGNWLGEISTEITGAVVVAADTSVSGVQEMVVVKDLPKVIDTNVFQLEAFAFDMGRLQPGKSISWTSSQPWATVGQDQVLTVTQSGELTLTAYLADKPEIETSVISTVDLSHVSGIKNNTNPEIRIWPNPASDMIRIEGFERARVSIYTVSGARVLVRENYTGGESIRLADLPGGLYIVRISSGRDSATAPLIKQ